MIGPLIDSHCHLDFASYDDDRDEVLSRALDAGVRRIVAPAVDIPSIDRVLALADKYEPVFAAVGIHPNDVPDNLSIDEALQYVREAAQHPKVVAIGEIGLDYHWNKHPHETQTSWLSSQLELAQELSLPVILHNRESTIDILPIIIRWATSLRRAPSASHGVLHSVSTTWEEAQLAIQNGFMVGFTDPITFKNSNEVRRVAANAPADRILIETDGPFLAPIPHRGARNEPAFVVHIAETIAVAREVSVLDIGHATTANACALFGWGMADI